MFLADVGDERPERALDDAAIRTRGRDGAQRRIEQAVARRVIGPDRHQQRPAIAHIVHDVLEIDLRQCRLVRVAVEDDQIEFVDLAAKEIGGREGDQRQLVDLSAVLPLLLRWAQDGEVDEIDVGVGLEQVAPGAFAGVGLARDKQHLQLVAYAIERDDGLVVESRQLIRKRRHFEFDDVRPAMLDLHRNARHDAGSRAHDAEFDAVAAHDHVDVLAPVVGVEHPHRNRLVLANDAKARRLDEFDAPVALARMAGDERMQRRAEAEIVGARRNVVHDAVGDEDRAADTLRRHVRQRAVQR